MTDDRNVKAANGKAELDALRAELVKSGHANEAILNVHAAIRAALDGGPPPPDGTLAFDVWGYVAGAREEAREADRMRGEVKDLRGEVADAIAARDLAWAELAAIHSVIDGTCDPDTIGGLPLDVWDAIDKAGRASGAQLAASQDREAERKTDALGRVWIKRRTLDAAELRDAGVHADLDRRTGGCTDETLARFGWELCPRDPAIVAADCAALTAAAVDWRDEWVALGLCDTGDE